MMDSLFFELIRVAIGTQDRLSRTPSSQEWKVLYDMAKKQSLVGICFAGVQKTLSSSPLKGEDPSVIGMPEMLYLTWMGMAAKIQQKNEQMNVSTKEALLFFREKGFPCQVLKGQGISLQYGNLSLLRQSGDIDVWAAGGREKIYQLSREVLGKITGANYHHIHFPIWKEPEIEAHIYPSFLSSPLRNKRLQDFCKLYEPKSLEHFEPLKPLEQGQDTPSLEFNLVFIMLHCYRHLSGHGVGLRQVMDYYFVLREASLQLSPEGKRESVMWIKKLGMERFARALAWVIGYVFDGDPNSPSFRKGLGEGSFVSNEKDGRFLLSEIMQTGNMGHADDRVDKSKLNSALGRYIYNFKRDLHVMRICPHEALWEPWFNLVLYVRRKFIWSRKYNLK